MPASTAHPDLARLLDTLWSASCDLPDPEEEALLIDSPTLDLDLDLDESPCMLHLDLDELPEGALSLLH